MSIRRKLLYLAQFTAGWETVCGSDVNEIRNFVLLIRQRLDSSDSGPCLAAARPLLYSE